MITREVIVIIIILISNPTGTEWNSTRTHTHKLQVLGDSSLFNATTRTSPANMLPYFMADGKAPRGGSMTCNTKNSFVC